MGHEPPDPPPYHQPPNTCLSPKGPGKKERWKDHSERMTCPSLDLVWHARCKSKMIRKDGGRGGQA